MINTSLMMSIMQYLKIMQFYLFSTLILAYTNKFYFYLINTNIIYKYNQAKLQKINKFTELS